MNSVFNMFGEGDQGGEADKMSHFPIFSHPPAVAASADNSVNISPPSLPPFSKGDLFAFKHHPSWGEKEAASFLIIHGNCHF